MIDFRRYLQYMSDWSFCHLRPVVEFVERSAHEPVRAVVSLPPRHGITSLIKLAMSWTSIRQGKDRGHAWICNRDMLHEHDVTLQASRAIELGLGGSYTPVRFGSIGANLAGRGIGSLLVIEDPIVFAEDAQDQRHKNAVWNWIRYDALTRLEGDASVIIVQRRKAKDDPYGRMITGGSDWEPGLGVRWDVVNLPAIQDAVGNPVDERKHPGWARPLWPSVCHPGGHGQALEFYAQRRQMLGEVAFSALYQGVVSE